MRLSVLFWLGITVVFAAEPARELTFEVFYTGRMLGHARVPNRQLSTNHSMDHCADLLENSGTSREEGPSPVAAQVRKQLTGLGYRAAGGKPLLVSLGDNFAPEYDARMIGKKSFETAKDLLVWFEEKWLPIDVDSGALKKYSDMIEKPGKATVPFDNVACYFKWLGYSAIVPGKHDFHFGAERLRQYAKLLHENGVEMLAPNVYVATSAPGAPAPLPERFRKRLLVGPGAARPYTTIDGEVKIVLPRTVYPWSPRVRVSGLFAYETAEGRRLRSDELANAPAGTKFTPLVRQIRLCPSLPNQPSTLDEGGCRTLAEQPFKETANRDTSLELKLPAGSLIRGRSYGLCVEWDASAKRLDPANPGNMPLCGTFSVVEPLMRYEEWSGTSYQLPYYVHHGGPHGDVAVFGLVSTALLNTVSRLDLSWHNTNRGLDTVLKVGDESDVLKQAVQACEDDKVCNAAPHRILLAQMPEESAGALARQVARTARFSAVIAEANLRGSTPSQSVVRLAADTRARSLVYSPGPVVGEDLEHLTPHAQRIQIFSEGDHREFKHTVDNCQGCNLTYASPEAEPMRKREGRMKELSNLVVEMQNEMASGGPLNRQKIGLNLYEAAHKGLAIRFSERARKLLTGQYAVEQTEVDRWTDVQVMQRLILESLRRRDKSDVVLLQRRDTFRLSPSVLNAELSNVDLREVFERILWKGDFLVDIGVKGSVLKDVMEQSKLLAARDGDLAKTETERDRDLLSLGIDYDPGGQQWHVNGAPLDPDRLYAVAMPDYLVFGDSGYPALKRPDGQNPARLSRWDELVPLAAVPCLAIVGVNELCGIQAIETNSFLDNVSQLAPDSGERTRPGERLLSWLGTGLIPRNPLMNASELSRRVQGRRIWAVTLEKAQFGYSVYQHNRPTERSVKGLFGGLASPQQVFSPESNIFDASYRLRTTRSYRPGNLFALGEGGLNRAKIRDAENSYIPDIKQNLLAGEFGWNPRLGYQGIHMPEWLGIVAFRGETNIMAPITSVRLGSGTIRETIAKTPSWAGKLGVRWAARSNWLEAGFLAGRRYNIPVGFGIETASVIAAARAAARGDSSGPIRPPRSGIYCSTAVVGTAANQPALPTDAPLVDRLAAADRLPFAECVSAKAALLGASHTPASPYGMLGDYRDRPRVGNFLNFRFQIPLPGLKDHYYVMENSGEWLYNTGDDLPLETRVLNVWTHSLQLGLWKNVSLVPKVELFYFRNKLQGNSITGVSSKINLQYRFDWRPGVSWREAKKFPYPAVAK